MPEKPQDKPIHSDPPLFPQNPDPFFEEKKNEFLAAVYIRDGSLAGSIYKRILQRAKNIAPNIGETDEKYLRQIQVSFKQFKPFLLAQEQLNLKEAYQNLQSLIQKNVREQSAHPRIVAYDVWKSRVALSSWQQNLIFANAITFQMSSGCSNYCRRCNEWALPKIRAHFSKEAVEQILEQLRVNGNTNLALYGASDPLDWEEAPYDLADILSGLPPQQEFSLLTKIPRGRDTLLLTLIEKGINLSVSLTDRNRNRIHALEKSMAQSISKQHATKDLLIPAGLDEDFISVKPSITDGYGTEITPEGAFLIIPTFTSALHPFGHKKLPITRDTHFFPVKKIGRKALLVDYFKPLEVMGREGQPFHLEKLLDVQVESILLDNGSDNLTPPGMRSLKEYFSIFDELPRRQRKKMTPSVIRRLKKEFFGPGGYQKLSSTRRELYKSKLAAHLEFCKKHTVAESKLCALSFFLAAVVCFIKRQPVKACIINFLVKDEIAVLNKKYAQAAALEKPIALFLTPNADVWEIFWYYATALLKGCHEKPIEIEKPIEKFIASFPSKYDPAADRFVMARLEQTN
jgi:hypothetical protein